jgi:D-3-phosphoglycerate dehydrogenase
MAELPDTVPDTVAALVRDLVASVAPAPRPYDDVMAAWRTSCPRLPVWETAMAWGFVARHPGGAGRPAMVEATEKGRAWLADAAHPKPPARRISP